MKDYRALLKLAVAGLSECNQPGCNLIATQFTETNEMGYDVSYVYCDKHAEDYMTDLSYADAVRESMRDEK